MAEMAPTGSASSAGGNTKPPRIIASIHWCFTLNNWLKEELDLLLEHVSNGSIKSYIWEEEIGEEGTPHLQGYIEFSKKTRPLELIKIKRIHWEKTRDVKSAILYCYKDFREGKISADKLWTNIKIQKPIKVLSENQLYDWQKEILNVVTSDPDDRSIYWYYEYNGNVGKSAFSKYLAVKHDAMILSGKSADCKYAIVKFHETKGYYPELIVFDIPRTMQDYISYECLESIKNGLFFSGKYESGQVVMNSPHIICFSNEKPDTSKMSHDRWIIKKIE